jgi:N-hydroxyarylamine O-acetyltransferase
MDLNSYLQRIGISGPLGRDLQFLKMLHLKHATTIPFENLDIQLGKGISLDVDDLQRKMIHSKRGGYCFEQNTLMQEVLRDLEYHVIACEARVRMGRSLVTSRTHMLLIVHLTEGRYLVDVGFGGDGLLLPVPLDGTEETQFLWTYRVFREGDLHVLQVLRQQQWFDLYAFVPEERHPVDFQVANWYTSAHPESRFVQTLTVQLPTPEARYILRNKLFIIQRGGAEESREIKTAVELLALLDKTFGLSFPAGTQFRNPTF